VFDAQQTERWFGPLGAVETAAALGAGIAIAPGVRLVLPAGLLAIAALGAIVALGCVLALRGDLRPSVTDPVPSRLPLRCDAYARTLFAIMAAVVLIRDFSAYLGFFALDARFDADETALAAFFGPIAAAQQALILLGRGVVAGPLLQRFGCGPSLTMLPASFLVVAPAVTVLVAVWPGAPVTFWLAVLLVPLFRILWEVGMEPTYYVVHQPLGDTRRLTVQYVTETVVEPAARGLAGLVIGGIALVGSSPSTRALGAAGALLLAALGAFGVARRLVHYANDVRHAPVPK